ncbi:MAG: TFIIB-type zinc ribbon-containing protein, partial [Terriglobia bacterium]
MHCPKCRQGTLATDSELAEIYCQRCGTVIEEKIVDLRDGMLEFDDENRLRRTSTSEVVSWIYPYKSLGSAEFASGNKVEDSYRRAYPSFEILWGSLRLPMHVRVYSALVYRKMYRRHITRGRS